MKLNRFQYLILLRIILLTVTLTAGVYLFVVMNLYYSLVVILFIVFYQMFGLFNFVNKTNKDLSRFLGSIKHQDFSHSYITKNFGKSFDELHEVFRNLTEKMQETRSEKEESLQYLQTIVKHVAIGLITYRKDGEIELINNAARKLLNVQSLKNIFNLPSSKRELLGILSSIKAGDKALVRLEDDNGWKEISIFAAEYKLRDREFTLVSLQDIKSELERERLSNELEIAHQVQIKLLPKECPIINGYSFSAFCEPAREVGGDYYDFIDLGNNKTGVVIGDVAGKGLPAAIYMTLTKGIFQSYAENNLSPKDVLIKMNKLIYHIIESGSFVSIFYGILDQAKNEFIFARAGHEAPIFIDSENKNNILLRTVGLALGLDNGNIFEEKIEEKSISLGNGDTIILYTDGITEANNKLNEEYGIDRLKDFLKEYINNSSSSLLELIHEDVNNFCQGTNQFDDMTTIIIKRE